MRPVRSLLMRIPDRRVRRLATIAILFAVSLLIGRVLEIALHKDTLEAVHKTQAIWIQQVRDFSPLGIARSYLGDFDDVMRGREDSSKADARHAAVMADLLEKQQACTRARVVADLGPNCRTSVPFSLSASDCMVNPSQPGCTEYLACLDAEPRQRLVTTPLECIESGAAIQIYQGSIASGGVYAPQSSGKPNILLVPVLTLLRGAERIVSSGLGGILIALFQVGVGFVLFLTITSAMSRTKEAGFGNGIANFTLGPIAVIALGGAAGLALQWLMLGALYTFSWITGLAAAAAGATGMAGGCWWCFTKLTEKSVEGTLTK